MTGILTEALHLPINPASFRSKGRPVGFQPKGSATEGTDRTDATISLSLFKSGSKGITGGPAALSRC